MTKEEILTQVQAVIDAPSVYVGLKEIAEEYVASLGKADEKEKAEKLIAALKECVQSIDEVIDFFGSEAAKEYFGEAQASALLTQAKEVKSQGGTICFCPACSHGHRILENKEVLLG